MIHRTVSSVPTQLNISLLTSTSFDTVLLWFMPHTNQLQTDKYHYLYRFVSTKLHNKSKDYIKSKYITHLQLWIVPSPLCHMN